jgi:AraC-like DNA-binding protein
MKETIEIKYITDDMYYTNKQISNSHIVYSNISNTAVQDVAKLHSLKFCLSGLEIYRINGYEKRLNPGEFILVNPGQNFEIIADKKNTEGICLFFEDSIVNNISDTIFENTKYNILDNIELMNNINLIKNNVVRNRLERVNINFNSLLELLTNDNKVLKHSLNGLEMRNNELSIDLAYRLMKVKEFIDNNYYENLDIDQLANLSYTSKFHFLRMYKKLFGTSPYHYILELKLIESKKLLKNHTTIEVASKLNFTDRSAFSNRFKRRFKENPIEYKNKMK